MKKKILSFVVMMILFSNACYAKETANALNELNRGLNPERSKRVDLGQLVVTPSRIEEGIEGTHRRIEVITSNDIQTSGAKDVSEVFSDVASVNISNYGGLGALKTIRMRGANPAQVLVLLDGKPLNSPRDGVVDLSTIPLDNIERIEVMPGAASSLYGAQAMGGTINIITKSPPETGRKTELTTRFGSFRTFIESLSHGARIGKFGYIVSGGYKSSGGFRSNSTFNSKDFNAKFDYKLNDYNTLGANCGFYKSRAGTPGPINSPDNDDIQGQLKNYIDLNWDLKLDEKSAILARLYNNYDRLEFTENSPGSMFDIAFKKDIHTTKVEGLDLRFNKEFFDFYELIAGYNYVKNLNDSTSTAKHKYTVNAGYLENQFNISDKAKLSISARVDDYSNFGTEFNPSINFLYNIWENSKIHTSVSRSFRAPTFNDLYWPDEGWAKGNPDLKPETGITYELGFDTKVNKYFSTGLTYYRNDFSDLINWVPDSMDVWQPQNIGRATTHGIESINKLYLSRNFEVGMNYTFLSARDRKTNKYLIYQPKNKADFSLKYKEFYGFDFALTGQWTGQRFHDAANDIKVKPFFLLGFNVSKKFKRNYEIFFSIDNLLNKKNQVVKDYPTPGLSAQGGVKVDF
ncbi:MAG: TonB-dependent receptor [Candidatus Omnitrophota bacterium]|nr:TonB-dependent receptor [Candidatus Omnitrophota bacterium]